MARRVARSPRRLARATPRPGPDIPSRETTTRDRSFALLARSSLSSVLAMSTLPQALVPSPPPLPLHAPRRVSVADRVARSFPPLACVRGFRYFTRKRVDLVRVSEGEIQADVKGKRTVRVTLRAEEGRLASACSCAAKVLGPAACHHVWATLLEIDRCGAFETLRTTQRSLALGVVGAVRPPPKAARAKASAKPKPSAPAKGAARGGP
jgi:hypothetical protein